MEREEKKLGDDQHDIITLQRSTPLSDVLRLLKLVFLRKEFYERFEKESFPTPEALPDKTPEDGGFWQQDELLQEFKNDDANVQVCICDKELDDGIDTSTCRTKDASGADLLSWYKEVERASSRSFSELPVQEGGSLEEIVVAEDAAPSSWKDIPIVDPVNDGPKKVLVTGGAGFIGSHVADALLARGDCVVIVDEVNDFYDVTIKESNLSLLKSKQGSDKLTIYRGDICDEALMSKIFETEQPQYVCHMAARAGVRPSIQDPYVYIHSNIRGTTVLMDLSVKYGVRNFVFASSSSVYGNSKSSTFSEDDVVDHPVSPYAATKKACELLAYTYHHLYKLNVTGLRFFTVYGPRGRPDMAPYKFIHQCCQGLVIEQFGDGSTSRDYTYIDDIVDGVVRAIDRPYPYQIFNLGKGSGTSLKEFLELVEKYVGKPVKIQVLPEQPGDVPYTCANVDKAEYLLGYKPTVSFEDGIKQTVEWYKNYCAENKQ